MTVTEQNFAAIETTLAKSNAFYHYTEIIPKTFLVSKDSRSWNHEDIFNHEPIRRFALAMVTNEAFLAAKTVNPFHFQKFNLQSITVYRNGYPIAGTPLKAENDKKLYLNSLEALQFKTHGHGVPFEHYENHYVLVFDLTSTQQASYDYLYPELTNASISIDLRFKEDLPSSVELLFLGEKASTIFVNSDRQVSKNRQLKTKTETRWLAKRDCGSSSTDASFWNTSLQECTPPITFQRDWTKIPSLLWTLTTQMKQAGIGFSTVKIQRTMLSVTPWDYNSEITQTLTNA